MKVAIASDHAGFPAKQIVVKAVKDLGHEVIDFGTNNCDSVDAVDYAAPASLAVAGGKAPRGIFICGSGIIMCIVANKFKGIRASIAHDIYSAAQGVQHNDMNVLCLGGKVVDNNLIPRLVKSFLEAQFEKGEERLQRRLKKLLDIEAKNMKQGF